MFLDKKNIRRLVVMNWTWPPFHSADERESQHNDFEFDPNEKKKDVNIQHLAQFISRRRVSQGDDVKMLHVKTGKMKLKYRFKPK